MTITKIITAALAAATIATGVQAKDGGQRIIDTAGKDLSNPAVVSQMRIDIKRSASKLCGVGRERDLTLDSKARECASQSIAQANAQLDRQVASVTQLRGEATMALADPVQK